MRDVIYIIVAFLYWFFYLLVNPPVAEGNAANCYWFLAPSPPYPDFTIRVKYVSGHTITVSTGDYLPFGCNVFGYEVAGSLPAGGREMILKPPACYSGLGGDYKAYTWCIGPGADGGTVHFMFPAPVNTMNAACAPACGVCNATPPNKPPIGQHPDPNGDNDNDGVRNDCDPDEVQCVDADGDGCCDLCEQNNTCQPPTNPNFDPWADDDNDGIRNGCDTDYMDCYDGNFDGCCDHCEECGPGDPCEGIGDHDGDGICNDCDPQYAGCADLNGNGKCDYCDPEPPEQPCNKCDPCPKLDQIILLLTQIREKPGPQLNLPEATGGGPDVPSDPPLVEVIGPTVPGIPEWLPVGLDFESPVTPWILSIPIPGRSPVSLTISPFASSYATSLTLVAALSTFQSSVRLFSIVYFAYRFFVAVFGSLASL